MRQLAEGNNGQGRAKPLTAEGMCINATGIAVCVKARIAARTQHAGMYPSQLPKAKHGTGRILRHAIGMLNSARKTGQPGQTLPPERQFMPRRF